MRFLPDVRRKRAAFVEQGPDPAEGDVARGVQIPLILREAFATSHLIEHLPGCAREGPHGHVPSPSESLQNDDSGGSTLTSKAGDSLSTDDALGETRRVKAA
jgi:hypothetical protein